MTEPNHEMTKQPKQREKAGWVSPSYGLSRTATLDPRRLAENRVVAFDGAAPEVEWYRVLRTRILQRTTNDPDKGVTIMITSAVPGEGKTLTAINLALTFSRSFSQTTLLVDADLRQQRIHEIMGYESSLGLADYLLDDCPVSDLIVWPGIEKLTVISGGKTLSESSELLGSPGMIRLVDEMKSRYPERYVFFDTPPVLATADALAFAPLVDHILLVVQSGKTAKSDVRRALSMLPREKVAGVVLNRLDPESDPYHFRMGYGLSP